MVMRAPSRARFGSLVDKGGLSMRREGHQIRGSSERGPQFSKVASTSPRTSSAFGRNVRAFRDAIRVHPCRFVDKTGAISVDLSLAIVARLDPRRTSARSNLFYCAQHALPYFLSMASNPDIRWKQCLQSFGKAFGQLSAAATLAKQRELSELEQQGLIQAFGFTHELAWNTLKDFLEARVAGNLYGSRDATREAFKQGLIANGDAWMDMIAARNRSSHTYNKTTADEVAAAIVSSFVQEFAAFQAKFTTLAQQEP